VREAKRAMESSPPAWPGGLLGVSVRGDLGAESPVGKRGVWFGLVCFFSDKLSGSICETQNGLPGDVATWRGSCPVLGLLQRRIRADSALGLLPSLKPVPLRCLQRSCL